MHVDVDRALRQKYILSGALPPHFPADIGVFWDFGSLHQHGIGGACPRTALEDQLFKTALSSMTLFYGHRLSVVLKLTAMPPCPSKLDPTTSRFTAVLPDGTSKELAWEYSDRGKRCPGRGCGGWPRCALHATALAARREQNVVVKSPFL